MSMTLEELRDVDVYAEVAMMNIRKDGVKWVADAIGTYDRIEYETDDELVEDARFNLEIMQTIYKETGEIEEWNEMVRRAKGGQKWMI